MKSAVEKILELYIHGKDDDKYQILEDIYSDAAVVEFEIHSKDISFPKNIRGNKEIARVLSKDFNEKYSNVKTYYLAKPKENQLLLHKQNWLVVMKEKCSGLTRVGTGYYNWKLISNDKKLKISRHKIYIHSMIELQDDNSIELKRIQSSLKYPWVQQQTVVKTLSIKPGFDKVVEFLIVDE